MFADLAPEVEGVGVAAGAEDAVPAGRRDAACLLARHLANLNMTLLYTSLSEYIFPSEISTTGDKINWMQF